MRSFILLGAMTALAIGSANAQSVGGQFEASRLQQFGATFGGTESYVAGSNSGVGAAVGWAESGSLGSITKFGYGQDVTGVTQTFNRGGSESWGNGSSAFMGQSYGSFSAYGNYDQFHAYGGFALVPGAAQ